MAAQGMWGGEGHTCALSGSELRCWGSNGYGQLGTGDKVSSATPKLVMGLSVVDADAGRSHTCAVLANGSATCWGDNQFGQLGDGSTFDSPNPVPVAQPAP
jgi:Regulator of chromosome condensation (RCC1) repeat